MAPGSRLLFLLAACVLCNPFSQAASRPDDRVAEEALATHLRIVTTIERSMLALIAIAPDEDRFDLYRAYDGFLGAWVQVDALHALLDRATTQTDGDDERATRTLRDYAEFTLGELDSAIVALADTARSLRRPDDYDISVVAGAELLRMRGTVAAILDAECRRLGCAPMQ